MRCLLAIAGVLVMAAPAHAQTAQRTCSGEFTDMRVIGLTLGDCDLNHISDTELSYVKGVCGEPWTPDSDGKVPKCTIKVVASRTKSIPRENHGYGAPLYQVRKVLQASAASLTLPRNVLGEWCHERDDDCEPDGVPGPMVVLPTSIKNWGDYEHDGIDCAVRVIPNWNGEASTTFANGYTMISFDLECRGRGKSFKGRALCRLEGDRLTSAMILS